MPNINFYNLAAYREKQALITRMNWQKGIYDFRHKREQRKCAYSECGEIFETRPSDAKKFCSQSCAAKVSNQKRSNVTKVQKEEIGRLYKGGLSMQEVCSRTGVSHKKVLYCLQKSNIPRRSISEAIYRMHNPDGNPFEIKRNLTRKDIFLKGLGIGLYWGEGHKRSKHSVKVANTDPYLVKKFVEFCIEICGVKKEKIKYGLQVFNDADPKKARNFWIRALKIRKEKLTSVSTIPPQGKGTYKRKSQYGVLSVYVHNMKLKDQLDKWLEEMM